jgi:hypothetical protein
LTDHAPLKRLDVAAVVPRPFYLDEVLEIVQDILSA